MSRIERKDVFFSSRDTDEQEAGISPSQGDGVDMEAAAPGFPLWFEELRPGGEGEGFLEKRGRNSLMFVRRPNDRLLVTFDNLFNVGDHSPQRAPWAYKYARDVNISHLGVMAHVSDWYRDPVLIERMRKLAADGFFDGYRRVVFAGTSMGAFAAIAFASLAPGAHVVAFNPQSTLDTDLVPWETRYWSGRRQDWTLPLSDAAAVTAGLGPVHIFYDPYFDLDRRHFKRFSGDNIREYKCWFSNHKSAVFIRKIDALKPIMQNAVFGELTGSVFYRLYRARRGLKWYRGGLCAYFDRKNRPGMSARALMAFRKSVRAGALEGDAVPASSGDPAPELHKLSEKMTKPPMVPTVKRDARKNDKVCIITTMKNEGPFMLEWIAYNRSIGFTDFLIYTNGCEDGTDLIGMRLQELGLAVHVDNRFKKGASPQRVALRRGFNHEYTQDADWLICADCDEFLNIRTGDGLLPALFDAVGAADAISVSWKIFGSGGQETYQDKFVTEQFFWSAPEIYFDKYRARGLKTLVRRNDKLLRMSVHRPKFHLHRPDLVWKDAGGRPMPAGYLRQGWSAHKDFNHDFARLHHYAVRSVDSFLVKRDRGRTNHIDRDQGLFYWADMNLNMEEDRSILPFVPAARKEFDALLADPELARLHSVACEWHAAKIEKLKQREGWTEFRDQILRINRVGEAPVDKTALIREEPSA